MLPLGLDVRLGDVVSVSRDGTLLLEGSCASLLGAARGPSRESSPGDLYKLSTDRSSCSFRAAGEASSLFPELPTASAHIDVYFESSSSWLLAAVGRRLHSVEDVNRLRSPIMDAYLRNVWKPDWALIVEVAEAERVTLMAARMADTKVALLVGAEVDAGVGAVQLTAGVSLAHLSQDLTHWIRPDRAVLGCRALRIRDSWWRRHPRIGTLQERELVADIEEASECELWEDMDEVAVD